MVIKRLLLEIGMEMTCMVAITLKLLFELYRTLFTIAPSP